MAVPGEPQVTSTALPIELTSFVGREHELQVLERLLKEARVCTITGAGGSGKTRLALQLARRALPFNPDGVHFAEFGNIRDASLFTQQLALVLDLREVPGHDLVATLTTHIQDKRMLLLLDGCEHLVEIAARVVDQLLRACPSLTFLVTSQEALNVPGEVAWRIPSLSVPAEEEADLERLRQSDAVRLFVERARLVSPHFHLNRTVAPAITEICRRLDGLPLAIELAAARVRVMPVEEVLQRLEDRFRLLTGGSRTAMARQQTLRATVDWSYQQLTESEQIFFRRLAVFSGSFGLEAAERVCWNETEMRESSLEILSRLVDRSMVIPDSVSSPARYRLLETLRQYGQEKLRDPSDEDIRSRHAEYFVGVAEDAELKLRGPEQLLWHDRLGPDHANFRAALIWAARQDQELALRLVGALGRYWYVSGHISELRDWLNATLTGNPPRGKYLSRALLTAGLSALWSGEYALSAHYAGQALEIAKEYAEQQDIGTALNQMGLAAHFTKHYQDADRLFREALAIRKQDKDRTLAAYCLNNLGLVAYDTGRLDEAEALISESITATDEARAVYSRLTLLDSLGRVKLAQGAIESAHLLFVEVLETAHQMGDLLSVGDGLEGLSRIAAKLSNPRQALLLAGAAARLRARIGYRPPDAWLQRFEADLDRARADLNDEAAAVDAWNEGYALPLADAVRLALAPASVAASLRRSDTLSKREWQVADLIVQGLSNRQIGIRLHLSERTVDSHVEHIRNKLGFHSRTQIAAWASSSRREAAGSTKPSHAELGTTSADD